MNPYKFYISSENEGKVKEILKFLHEEIRPPFSANVLTLNSLDESQKNKYNPVENGISFLENARIKARALYSILREPVLADDSGLEVDALNGEPGVFSSRYEKTDELRIGRLLRELTDFQQQMRSARFISCLCFIDKFGNEIFFNGKVEGIIIDQPRGNHGFGYDPVFYYPPLNKTFGELTPDEKQNVSHRSHALKLFVHFLAKYIEFSA
ncbi:MAG: RdgB/HAM1 family non-canonical purine NTP pyrophosphatase [Spirochaetia bacterium]|nr:RdgB/HAM1 family non-canonical purine NTP pyrophosphatase [Spirochaetia bacterium]